MSTSGQIHKGQHADDVGAVLPEPNPPRRFWLTGLSARLLGLTILFVMLAEVLIFLPSIGRALEVEVRDRIKDADLAIAMLEGFQTDTLDRSVDRRLLALTQAELIARTGDGSSKALFTTPPKATQLVVDLEKDPQWSLVSKAIRLLALADPQAVMRVVGPSPTDSALTVEMLFFVQPVRSELWAFAVNVLQLSLVISLVTAGLVYLVLQSSIVRPVRRLSLALAAFARRPLSTFEELPEAKRGDEVGEASRALLAMRQTVRNSLVQNQRLVSLGTGITQINHDLRNLLSTALLLSEQLESSDDPKVRQKMMQISSSIEAAADLCQQTLSFAREGSVMLRKKTYRLDQLMSELDILLGLRFPQLDLAVTIPDGAEQAKSARLSVDIVQLERVLVNLVGNATQAGAVTVWLDAGSTASGDWQIQVSDDGSGLMPKALDRLFEPFAATTKQDGTGLGLYSAREIMRAHDGDLVLSDPGPLTGGASTTFVLTFCDDRLLGKSH